MKTNALLLTGLSLAVSALTLTAQNADGGPRRGNGPRGPQGGPGGRPQLLMQLDANKDGILTSDELAGAPAILLQLDANKDGAVSADELHPAGRGPQPRGGGRGPGATGTAPGQEPAGQAPAHQGPKNPCLAAIDLNTDGALSADEIAAAPQSMLKLDANQDGQLTRDEIRPEGAPGHGQGRGQGGPGFRGGPRHNGQDAPPADAAAE